MALVILTLRCIIMRIKQIIYMSVRGRPIRSKVQEYIDMKHFKRRTQYPATLSLLFMIYTKLVTSDTNLCSEIRESGFEWLSFLPKTFFKSIKEVQGCMAYIGFQLIFKNQNFRTFLSSVWGSSHKVIILEFTTICEEYLWFMNEINDPDIALTLLRYHYLNLTKQQLDRKFKHMRFNVTGVHQANLGIIKSNIDEVWKQYILILTKLVYLIGTQQQIGNLSELYRFNITSQDAFEQEVAFIEIGESQNTNFLEEYKKIVEISRKQPSSKIAIITEAYAKTGVEQREQVYQSTEDRNMNAEESKKTKMISNEIDSEQKIIQQPLLKTSQKFTNSLFQQPIQEAFQRKSQIVQFEQPKRQFVQSKSFQFTKNAEHDKMKMNFGWNQSYQNSIINPLGLSKKQDWQARTGQGIVGQDKDQEQLLFEPAPRRNKVHEQYNESLLSQSQIKSMPKKHGKLIHKIVNNKK